MVHEYTSEDLQICFPGQKLLYIGDSTVRQIFWATAKKLHPAAADELTRDVEKHSDIDFNRYNVTVKFIWDPFLNSTTWHRELIYYAETVSRSTKHLDRPAGLMVVGGGLWHARHFGTNSLKSYEDAVNRVVQLTNTGHHTSHTDFQSINKPRMLNNYVYLTPVQIPIYDYLSPSRAASITPNKVNAMNEYLHRAARREGIKVAWSHSLMTWQRDSAFEQSGLHVLRSVASSKADVILNARCNAIITKANGYPMDKTCCSAYDQPSWIPSIIFLGCSFFLFIVVTNLSTDEGRGVLFGSGKVSNALCVLLLSLLYCFVADRTQIFNKLHKQFSNVEFLSLCTIALGAGLLSIRRSTTAQVTKWTSVSGYQDQSFLSREQTDEWKGWMQFFILIYHYTGASKVLWIYEIIRILVASYLFMTGFGHTVFFYRKEDYSLQRFASVVVRLNLLSCLLPYLMQTNYLFYYFAPLNTFWYLIVYLTMRLGSSRSKSIKFLLCKIFVSAFFVTFLISTPGILEKTFIMLKSTCRINWDVLEWRFRVRLDGYIVYIGMLVGVAFVKVSEALHPDHFRSSGPGSLILQHWPKYHLASVILALIALPVFWAATRRSPNKFDYNWWVPYISMFPILSYVTLRNCHHHLRSFHSSIFAWLGRCSLETFTLQFHIWLAADTKGLLSLGIFGRKDTHIEGRHEDLVILTVVFILLSSRVSNATGTITRWIVNPQGPQATTEMIEMQRLPTFIGGGILSPSHQSESWAPKGLMRKLWNATVNLLQESLASRLFLILGVMWGLNMVSYITHDPSHVCVTNQ